MGASSTCPLTNYSQYIFISDEKQDEVVHRDKAKKQYGVSELRYGRCVLQPSFIATCMH